MELAAGAAPVSSQAIPYFRKLDGQELWMPQHHQRVCFDPNQRSFSVGECRVIPLLIETYSESNHVGCMRWIFRYKLEQALWDGVSLQKQGQIIPGTATEVRLVDSMSKESAVLLTPVLAGSTLERAHIPSSLLPFVHATNGSYFGEHIPAGLLKTLQEETENLILGTPTFEIPNDSSIEKYPKGGAAGFVRDMRPSLERHSETLTRLFGPFLIRNIVIRWIPENDNTFAARAHVDLVASFDGRMHTLVSVHCRGVDEIVFAADKELANLDTLCRHELTHAVLREALPADDNIQEVAAVFMEHTLEGPYNGERLVHAFDYDSLESISDDAGLGVTYAAHLAHRGPVAGVHRSVLLREFLRIAGGRENFLRILKASKKAALRRGPNQDGLVQVPSIDEWLAVADSIVSSFSKDYRSSVLSRPMKAGDRTIIGMHAEWGCMISFMHVDVNPQVRPSRETNQGPQPCYGVLSPVAQSIIMRFPDISTTPVTVTSSEGFFIVSPGFVLHGLRQLDSAAQLSKGANVIIEIPVLSRTIDMVWNEKAERRLQREQKERVD